jgi:tetratricopeptide (TPR) repeat protein
VIDEAVQANPGDPELLRTRWLILLSTRDFREAFAQGDELVKIDTSFADTTYFIRTAAAYAADSQFQKSAETASKGVAKFPGHPGLTYSQIVALRSAGQNQQALEALEKAISAKIEVENGSYLRLLMLKDLSRATEIVPAARELIAAGDTSLAVRQMVVQVGNDQFRAAGASKSPDDFANAIATLKYADSIASGQLKAQAQFLLGAAYTSLGGIKLQDAYTNKTCQPAKDAKDMFVEAQIMLPKGGSFAPDAMRQYMGQVMQLDSSADQIVKAYCK